MSLDACDDRITGCSALLWVVCGKDGGDIVLVINQHYSWLIENYIESTYTTQNCIHYLHSGRRGSVELSHSLIDYLSPEVDLDTI